jgi:hypothetical protein
MLTTLADHDLLAHHYQLFGLRVLAIEGLSKTQSDDKELRMNDTLANCSPVGGV